MVFLREKKNKTQKINYIIHTVLSPVKKNYIKHIGPTLRPESLREGPWISVLVESFMDIINVHLVFLK